MKLLWISTNINIEETILKKLMNLKEIQIWKKKSYVNWTDIFIIVMVIRYENMTGWIAIHLHLFIYMTHPIQVIIIFLKKKVDELD